MFRLLLAGWGKLLEANQSAHAVLKWAGIHLLLIAAVADIRRVTV